MHLLSRSGHEVGLSRLPACRAPGEKATCRSTSLQQAPQRPQRALPAAPPPASACTGICVRRCSTFTSVHLCPVTLRLTGAHHLCSPCMSWCHSCIYHYQYPKVLCTQQLRLCHQSKTTHIAPFLHTSRLKRRDCIRCFALRVSMNDNIFNTIKSTAPGEIWSRQSTLKERSVLDLCLIAMRMVSMPTFRSNVQSCGRGVQAGDHVCTCSHRGRTSAAARQAATQGAGAAGGMQLGSPTTYRQGQCLAAAQHSRCRQRNRSRTSGKPGPCGRWQISS